MRATRCGTDYAYHLGCRCGRCSWAHSQHVAVTRARAKAKLTPDDPRHGTRNGFDNLGCRCGRCTAAKAASRVGGAR